MPRLHAIVFALTSVPMLAAAQQFLPAAPGAPADPDSRFEVASIKPFDSTSGQMMMRLMPGRFDAIGLPVRMVLRQALQKPDYQIVGTPGWIDSERYAITAKMPDGAPQSAMSVMLVNLLKDRFQLASHVETRELPIFNLVLARADGRLGPDLRPSSKECQDAVDARRKAPPSSGPPPLPPGGPPAIDPSQPPPCGSMRRGPDSAAATGLPVAQLVQMLSDITGRLVVDKTNLGGPHDFTLKFAADSARSSGPFGLNLPGAPAPPVDPNAPNVFTALQEQLGLKLDSARGPVEVVVIDKFEKPTLD